MRGADCPVMAPGAAALPAGCAITVAAAEAVDAGAPVPVLPAVWTVLFASSSPRARPPFFTVVPEASPAFVPDVESALSLPHAANEKARTLVAAIRENETCCIGTSPLMCDVDHTL